MATAIRPVPGGHPSGNSHLRDTHPNLYRSLMTVGLIEVALGFNFLLTTPTFQQFGIPKNLVGAVFLALGLTDMVLLNVFRNIRAVRAKTVVGTTFMACWGVGTTETFFLGKSSLQLCILYFGLAALQAPLLLEPFLNPVTANGDGNGNGKK